MTRSRSADRTNLKGRAMCGGDQGPGVMADTHGPVVSAAGMAEEGALASVRLMLWKLAGVGFVMSVREAG